MTSRAELTKGACSRRPAETLLNLEWTWNSPAVVERSPDGGKDFPERFNTVLIMGSFIRSDKLGGLGMQGRNWPDSVLSTRPGQQRQRGEQQQHQRQQ